MSKFIAFVIMLLTSYCAYGEGYQAPMETMVVNNNLLGGGICWDPPALGNKFSTRYAEIPLSQPVNAFYAVTSSNIDKVITVESKNIIGGVRPRKYLAILKSDPRFAALQAFILKYNYTTAQYEVLGDVNGLTQYNTIAPASANLTNIAQTYNNYFITQNSSIDVSSGEIVNISAVTKSNFWGLSNLFSTSQYQSLLTPESFKMYTNASVYDGFPDYLENMVIAFRVQEWCAANSGKPPSQTGCYGGTHMGLDNANKHHLMGIFLYPLGTIADCPNSNPAYSTVCKRRNGSGIIASVGSDNKDLGQVLVPFTYFGNSIMVGQYTSGSSGKLSFKLADDINTLKSKMITGFNPDISQWSSYTNYDTSFKNNAVWNYLVFGTYFLKIEVGGMTNIDKLEDVTSGIKLQYTIASGDPYNSSTLWSDVPINGVISPGKNGNLYFRTIYTGTENVGDLHNVTTRAFYTVYTGGTLISSALYDVFLNTSGNSNSLAANFKKTLEKMYITIIAKISNIVKASLTLYILLYGAISYWVW